MKGLRQTALFILLLVGILSASLWINLWRARQLALATGLPTWKALLIVLK